jgi:hypothetical protein
MVQHADIDHTGITGVGGVASELVYTQITGNVTVTGTNEAGATTVITSGAITVDGSTNVMVEFFCPRVSIDIASAGQGVVFDLYDDSTIVGRIAVVILGADGEHPVVGRARVTNPANGSVFVVKAWKTTSNGVTATVGSGGTGAQVPGFIRVTRA